MDVKVASPFLFCTLPALCIHFTHPFLENARNFVVPARVSPSIECPRRVSAGIFGVESNHVLDASASVLARWRGLYRIMKAGIRKSGRRIPVVR